MSINFEEFQEAIQARYLSADIRIYKDLDGFCCVCWVKGKGCRPKVPLDFKLWEIVSYMQVNQASQGREQVFELFIGGVSSYRCGELRELLDFLSSLSSQFDGKSGSK